MIGGVMRRGGRRWGGLALAVAPLFAACYTYAPLTTPEPQPGVRLALDLNDEGRAALSTNVGPEVARVEGALVSNTDGEYVIQVSDVLALGGTRAKWGGETVGFRQQYVKQIRERRFSRGRTAFLVGGLVGAVVAVVAGTNLLGIGGDADTSTRGGGGPGDQ